MLDRPLFISSRRWSGIREHLRPAQLPRSVRQLKGGEDVKVTILGATQQGNFVALRSGAVVLKAR
jgi:hypothetical protein